MTESEFIHFICESEKTSGCYNINIDGICAYSLIRQEFRNLVAYKKGIEVMTLRNEFCRSSILSICKSTFFSLIQYIKLIVSNKKAQILFISFPRVDKIGDMFIDKFTDPLIEIACEELPCVVLESGIMGIHKEPRAHSEIIIYIEFLKVWAFISNLLKRPWMKLKYKHTIMTLRASLSQISDGLVDVDAQINKVLLRINEIIVYKHFYKKLGAKVILAPTRPATQFIAAHLLGILVCELQHGITYDESSLYSGYRDSMLVPDYFLAYGDNKPLNVYGIDEKKIVNIGWALQNYILGIHTTEQYQPNSVLAISDQEVSESMFEIVCKLAEHNPEITFYVRPHPYEIISDSIKQKILFHRNVKIQDKSINISIVLQGFDNVIGENSTVLYEALSVGKKVGKLYYKGLNPQYLEESDRECFWEIHNQKDFEAFIYGEKMGRKNKSIYSPFDKEKFLEIIGI